MTFSISISELLDLISPARAQGTTTETVRGVASLSAAKPGDISFLSLARYKAAVASSDASVVLVPDDFVGAPKPGQMLVRVANPSLALARMCRQIETQLWPRPAAGVHPSAVISHEARLAPDVVIGPLCVIDAGAAVEAGAWLEAGVFVGHGARIGAGSRIGPGCKILADCMVGCRVILQAGAVIGSDGFGYETAQGRHEKVPQIGNVMIGDDVEIGANTTVDRARFSSTVVGEGTKIDNLVQVGHNVVIGRHCFICAQVGISGSTTVEDYVVLGGQAGLAGHLIVGRGSKVDGQSGVNSDLSPGSVVKGSPCLPYNLEQRLNVLRKKVPDLFKRVDVIEAALHLGHGTSSPAEARRV